MAERRVTTKNTSGDIVNLETIFSATETAIDDTLTSWRAVYSTLTFDDITSADSGWATFYSQTMAATDPRI